MTKSGVVGGGASSVLFKNSLDKVTLVNLEDKKTGEMDKYEAHEHPAKLHRASSVWLVNSFGQVLLQKRSDKKIVGAGWWGNAICGNVRPEESYEGCAIRRLREEIGVGSEGKNSVADVGIGSSKLKPIYKLTYKAYCNEKYGEYEIDQVFLGKYDGEVDLNKDEVSKVVWVDLSKLLEQVSEEKIKPEETLNMNLEQLKKYTAPIKIEINEKKQLLAPWTVMMLGDSRLVKLAYSS